MTPPRQSAQQIPRGDSPGSREAHGQQDDLTAQRQNGILISTVNHTAKENRMKAKATKQPATPETVKTTLRLPVALWDRVQHYSIDSKQSLQQIAESALEAYLKAGKK